MRSRRAGEVHAGSDLGGVTAEFAAALPAAALVLACCLGGVAVAGTQLRLQDAAALAARAEARGGDPGAAVASVAGARYAVRAAGGLVCVDLVAPGLPFGGPLGAIEVRATGCALADGQ
jgi:hypothetical protein